MATVRWQISSVFRVLLTQKDGKLNLVFELWKTEQDKKYIQKGLLQNYL